MTCTRLQASRGRGPLAPAEHHAEQIGLVSGVARVRMWGRLFIPDSALYGWQHRRQALITLQPFTHMLASNLIVLCV